MGQASSVACAPGGVGGAGRTGASAELQAAWVGQAGPGRDGAPGGATSSTIRRDGRRTRRRSWVGRVPGLQALGVGEIWEGAWDLGEDEAGC